ncbi:PKD domain-containing protein [Fluviicola sp.]|uniref:PKD domain-containing protein n=1 Tax=Fluviicola sp. TaxID=1917219 RepID=UPI0031E3896A
MKKITFWSYILLPLCMLLSSSVFSQGGDDDLSASFSPISLPFNALGSTVFANNDFDDIASAMDDGPDWFYYYCATSSATIWTTISFNPGGLASPVYPQLTIYNASTLDVVAIAQVAGDNSGTMGAPFDPVPGECYVFWIDNGQFTGFDYAIQITNVVPPNPPAPTQPACTNIGFDSGSTSGWQGSWGHSMKIGAAGDLTPIYTPMFFTMNSGQHDITTGGVDMMAPIDQVCPLVPGNTNSIRLGDGANGAFGGSRIEQKFQVTSSNALFTYYYAAVLQNAYIIDDLDGDGIATDTIPHLAQEQPYFQIDAQDCFGNPIACGNLLVTGGPGIPGFTQIGNSGVFWKDWTPVMLDLTPYIGSCITIRFTVGDCSQGAHYAYAYLDATCAPMTIVSPPDVCQYQTSTLTAPVGAASYSWVETSNPGTVLGTSNTLSITPTTTGTFTYQCTLTSLVGCNSTVTASVTVVPGPDISVTNPAAVCSPATVDLTAPGVTTINAGSGTLEYFSNAACTVPLANPGAVTTAGTYYIRLSSPGGCSDVEPVVVTYTQLPVQFTSDVTSGCAPLTVTFTNSSSSSANCVWTFEGGGTQVGCGSVTQQYSASGTYDVTLTVTDPSGCTGSVTHTDMITIAPQVNASFGVNTIEQPVVYPVFHFTNTSTNATSYFWEFGDGNTSMQTSPSHTYPNSPAVYHVVLHASNEAGCNDSAVVVVSVVDDVIIYVPNTFTPDGDEHNNVFFPVLNSAFDGQNYTLLIFNRWGEVLFESHDISYGWDGTYMGDLCKEGVYTWKIVVKERNKDKRREYVGHVNLLK